MTIRSNGDVVACCYDLTSNMILGNVTKEKMVDIWHGDIRKKYVECIRSGMPNEYCKECNVINPNCYLVKK